MVAIDFTAGDYNSSNVDGNGFWLTIGTYTATPNNAANTTTVVTSDLTLRHSFTGTQFTNFTLYVYLRAEYTLNGVATTQYFFGDADGASVGLKSMTGGSTSLLGSRTLDIPHNSDGTRPDLVIRGYCDSTSTASFVPESTRANTAAFALERIPKGQRVTGSGTSTPLLTAKRFRGDMWVDVTMRKRFNGTSWVDVSN